MSAGSVRWPRSKRPWKPTLSTTKKISCKENTHECHAGSSTTNRGQARSIGDQHDPDVVHRRRAASKVRTSGHAHGARAVGVHDLESHDAVRSEGPDLAQSRQVRAFERPCLDAALVDASPDKNTSGERGI